MPKRILLFITLSSIIGVVLFYANNIYLKDLTTRFSLINIYLFFTIASCIIYALVELVAEFLPNQAGFAYLATMFIKIGLFLLIFKNAIFAEKSLEVHEKTSIILPFFLFLITEGIMIGKLLNKK